MAFGEDQAEQKVSRRDAEMLVRGWNLLYNRTLSYSYQHPLVQDTLPKVYSLFEGVQKKVGTLNILIQEAMFFVDSVDVMYQPNNHRVAEHMRRFGVEAVTFLPGFNLQQFGGFIDACGLIHPDASSFAKYVAGHGVDKLEVNKVALRAVKEGDAVLAGGVVPGGAGGAAEGGISGLTGGGSFQDIVARAVVGRLTTQEIEGNMLLAQLLAQPDSLAKTVIQNVEETPDMSKANVEGMLLGVLSQFAQSSGSSGHSIEEILSGIYNMRSEMLSVIKTQKELDDALKEDDIKSATDDAFERTVCQIAADDWKRSKGNAKRMATVLTRVVPGRKELRQLMPRLKETFLEMGVTLQQWYELVAEITNLFGMEKSIDQLSEVAAEFGVKPDEIISELKRDPRASAKLLLASAEIRRVGGSEAEDRMIQTLLDTIDQTGEKLAESAAQDPAAAVGMAQSFKQMQAELEQQIGSTEMDPTLRQAALKKLEHRSQHSMNDLKARAFVSQLGNEKVSEDEKVGMLQQLSDDREEELDSVLTTALSLVGEDEVARQIAKELVSKTREKILLEREKRAGRALPAGIYPRAVLEFYLRLELKRTQRYNSGFTCILLSFQGLPEDPQVFRENESQLRGLANALAAGLHQLLRESDFVGYFGYNRYFIILPMTFPPNDQPVIKKLKDRLSRQVALPSGKAWARPRLGAVTVDGCSKMTLQQVYEAAARKWQEDL